MKRYEFDFERLEVYQMALRFAGNVFHLTAKFDGPSRYSLGEQFRRAALSICNNIAEGSGKSTPAAKRQFYGYSLDSARECIPTITLARMQQQLTESDEEHLRKQCVSICNMVARLKATANRRPQPLAMST